MSLEDSSHEVAPYRYNTYPRYREAYRVASVIIGIGTAVKLLGYVAGIGVCLWWVKAAIDARPVDHFSASQLGIYTACAIGGSVVYAAFAVVGIFVIAIGQLLRATLDTAVHTSREMEK